MDGIAGKSPALTWVVNISALLLVLLWTIPTFGLLISSIRDKDQLATSGWWTSLASVERNLIERSSAPDTQVLEAGIYVITGNVLVLSKAMIWAKLPPLAGAHNNPLPLNQTRWHK